ncbi:hypothetical protein [Chitinimonas lacunae]|uniref:VCBS repeat-containing protein n=1 Tax=Chitinimonas lacunae TaxID=1963018 RepID=A0ABV8MXE5_9NEIS
MKIQESQVHLASHHQASRDVQRRERLQLEAVPRRSERVELSEAGQNASRQLDDIRAMLEKDPLWNMVRAFVKQLTGREIELDDLFPPGLRQGNSPAPTPAPDSGVAWRIDYQQQSMLRETESTRFSASGQIVTADGRSIEFDAALDLYRDYQEYSETRLSAGPARPQKDPLVINFGAASASLSEDKIRFDLDADGQQESISFLLPGSGFVALDRNGDGQVNDGSELFGAQSGDGFGDLATFDDDRNGWIDESDAVWASLKVWTRDEAGGSRLMGVGELGVGALHLGHAATDFALTDSSNNRHGQVRQTGIFLNENGTVGTVQKIDLSV